jgi:hypothetical protein
MNRSTPPASQTEHDQRHRTDVEPGLQFGQSVDDRDQRGGDQQDARHIKFALVPASLGHVTQSDDEGGGIGGGDASRRLGDHWSGWRKGQRSSIR